MSVAEDGKYVYTWENLLLLGGKDTLYMGLIVRGGPMKDGDRVLGPRWSFLGESESLFMW